MEVPEKWMTGTQNLACLAGVTGAIDYVANLLPSDKASRVDRLDLSFEAIRHYEEALANRMIAGLLSLPRVKLFGISSAERLNEPVPTIAVNIEGYTSAEAATLLGSKGIYVWHGNYYALQLSRRLGQEPNGMVRIGLMHYIQEVDRTLETIAAM